MMMEEVEALSYPASAIINGDYSGELTSEDRDVIAHLESLGDVVDVVEAGDGICSVTGLFGQLATYVVRVD